MRKLLLMSGDMVMLGIGFLVVVLREGQGHLVPHIIAIHTVPFLLLGVVTLTALYAMDLYDFRYIRPVANNLRRLAAAVSSSLIIGAFCFYLLPFFHITPKTNLLIFYGVFTTLFLWWRRSSAMIFAKHVQYPIVIWSPYSDIVNEIMSSIAQHPERGYRVIARIDTLATDMFILPRILVIPDDGIIPDHLLQQLFARKVVIMTVSDFYERYFLRLPVTAFQKASFVYTVRHRHMITRIIYRCIEWCVALFTLIITLPFVVLAAIAIWIEDGGSIFYIHERVGFLGRPFKLYKLRSMKVSSTDRFGEWRTKDDPRVTRVGNIISKLHLDEVPQMINVLKGDMAIVGPRPDMLSIAHGFQEQIPQYHLRLLVKPGFTGWAQIKYINPQTRAEYERKLEYDLYYIKHREPFLDLGILLRTIQIIFSHF